MSEIKFACPHCGQHIACNPDYADLEILCPACNQPMEVPRLSAAERLHPDMCVVASIPRPKRRFSSRIPTIDLWTEKEWEDGYRAATAGEQRTPAWVVSGLGTVIAAALLKAVQAPPWVVLLCVLVGTILSGYLMVIQRTITGGVPIASGFDGALSALVRIGLLLLAIPAIALGVLFVGCAVCH